MGLETRKSVFGVSKQQRHRPACSSMQSEQHLCYSLIGKYILTCRSNFNFIAISVAEQPGLSLALSEFLKTGFVATRPILLLMYNDIMSSLNLAQISSLCSNLIYVHEH